MQTVQYGAIVGQVNLAHQPPTVSLPIFLCVLRIQSVYECTLCHYTVHSALHFSAEQFKWSFTSTAKSFVV